MENASQEKSSDSVEVKERNPITGLLLGVIAFLTLTLGTIALLLFTNLSDKLLDTVGDEIETEVEEQIEVVDTEVVTVKNEGWALYSIPEYGFSVEIPPVAEYIEDFNQYMRWEISRGQEFNLEEDSLDGINIHYYPSGMSPEIRACGQGCNGEWQIWVDIFEKGIQYNLESIKERQIEEFNNRIEGMMPDGYNETLEDAIQEPDPFGEDVWCIRQPTIADGNFRQCYLESGEYIFEIVHTGINLTDFGVDAQDTEIYQILDSMKFE